MILISPIYPLDQTLLEYIKQDKQQDALREKICARFEVVTEPREWLLLGACLRLLGYSDKGMRRTMEQLRCFKTALGLPEVFKVFEVRAIRIRIQILCVMS